MRFPVPSWEMFHWNEERWQQELRDWSPFEIEALAAKICAERTDFLERVRRREFPAAHASLSLGHLGAQVALSHLNESHAGAVPALLGLYREHQKDLTLASTFVKALAGMVSCREQILPQLWEELRHFGVREFPSSLVKAFASYTTAEPNPWVERLAQGLTGSPTLEGCRGCALVLAELGPIALGAVPALLAATHREDGELRSMAALALGNIGGGAEVLERLLELARSDCQWYVRGNAVESASRWGDPAVLPVALEILKDDAETPDWCAPECAARALARLGLPEALPALRQAVRENPREQLAEACFSAAAKLAAPESLRDLCLDALHRSDAPELWELALQLAFERFPDSEWCAAELGHVFQHRGKCGDSTLLVWLRNRIRLSRPWTATERRNLTGWAKHEGELGDACRVLVDNWS